MLLMISILSVLAVCTVIWLVAVVVQMIRDAVNCYGVAEYRLERDGSLTPIKRRGKK